MSYIILFAVIVFLAVLLIRTAAFKPKPQSFLDETEIKFDEAAAVDALAELVRCKTVSYYEKEKEDDSEFKKLYDKLPKLYPEVFKAAELIELPERALLFKWSGKSSQKPTVLMAHFDVVPVNEENWEKPPFDAVIEDGVMWGRGTLDTKVTFNGILTAANTLIAEGFIPENDIYMAFSGGEEVNGEGALNIVKWFEEKGITPELIVDEGGAVVENVFPGVKAPCGLIGIAEKGMLNLEFSVKSAGGHASAPKPHTPIGELSSACVSVEGSPFPMHLTRPAAEMFDTLGRHSNFLYRMIFANLWIFKGVLNMLAKKNGGEMNALLRTTVAFTQASGSEAPNVIPPKARLVANLRLNPEDSIFSATEYIRRTVNNNAVELTVLGGMEPSRVSVTDCEAYRRVESAVGNTWKGSIVSPYLMVQCSDCRHYGRTSNHVYRFSAMAMTGEERSTIHGNNERIKIENIGKAVEFFIRIVKNS